MSRQPVARPRVHRPKDCEDASPHSVYRIYDANNVLLYVGVAHDVIHRIYMHEAAAHTSWASTQMVGRIARHTSTEYPTKLAARAAERRAIYTEVPLFNRQHNGRRWHRVNRAWVERPAPLPLLAEAS